MNFKLFTIIYWIIAISIIGFAVANCFPPLYQTENISITGKVINAELLESYMILSFDDGLIYNISYPTNSIEYDFTVNSEMTIKLSYTSWWLMPNSNNVWDIDSIIKVPNNEV